MSMTDPIADLLTRIRNAAKAGHVNVDIPASNMKTEIARILRNNYYIRGYRVTEDGKQGVLRVYLKYTEEETPTFKELKRVSRPGLRQYVTAGDVPKVKNGLGIAIISTSDGILSDREARRKGVGGEVICTVW
ncbi:30S ribosomal protein S8 [Gemmatimonadota bacterium]